MADKKELLKELINEALEKGEIEKAKQLMEMADSIEPTISAKEETKIDTIETIPMMVVNESKPKKSKKILIITIITILAFLCASTFAVWQFVFNKDKTTNNVAKETEIPFTMGNVSGNTYTNEYIGIKYKADSTWKYDSLEEIAKTNGLTSTNNLDSNLSKIENPSIMAVQCDSGSNISIKMCSAPGATEDDISAFYSESMELYKQEYKNYGIHINELKLIDISLDGKTTPSIYIDLYGMNKAMYQLQFILKCHEHVAMVTITAMSKEEAYALLNNFTWLD